MIRKTINGGNFKPQMVGELEFDQVPEEGSFNPVTSDGVAKAIGGAVDAILPAGTSESNPLMNAADTERMILEISPIAANTLRFNFSKADYDPTIAGVGSSGTWKKVTKYCNVWDWTISGTSFDSAFENAFADSDNIVSIIAAGDTSSVTDMRRMFDGCSSLESVQLFDTSAVTTMAAAFRNCSSLKSVPLFDTSAVTTMVAAFRNCTSLKSVPLFNTSAVTIMNLMFTGCTSLKSVPLFDTSSVTTFNEAFYGCTSLESVPLFDTSSVTDVGYMFYNCVSVTEGALALYQQASTQATPPTVHTDAFKNCGSGTTTGAVELAQIPTTWGGTAA